MEGTSSWRSLPIWLRRGLGIVILVVLIGAGIGVGFLPNPYSTIGFAVLIASVVVACAIELRTCYRLAQTSEQSAYLHPIALWGLVAVLSTAALLAELAETEKQPSATVLPLIALLLALIGALQLAVNLLKRGAGANSPAPGSAVDEAKTPPNKPLQM